MVFRLIAKLKINGKTDKVFNPNSYFPFDKNLIKSFQDIPWRSSALYFTILKITQRKMASGFVILESHGKTLAMTL